MIPDISHSLKWLEENPRVLQGIRRGIEREALRIDKEGRLAQTPHPSIFGSALTHPWITTDFSESMLEFITPADDSIERMMASLRDIHAYAARHMENERLWPFSMPCYIETENDIPLSQYGSSNLGKFKTLYREGLKNRYGALMQTICGVHYNFSFPLLFWQIKEGISDELSGKDKISSGYFNLIRNYYRFGWVIPYLFGASPALCPSFLKEKSGNFRFEQLPNGLYYLPYATSLRMSDLGYTNKSQSNLGITFNNLQAYTEGLKNATRTLSDEFSQIGVQVDGHYRQLNANILQTEQEFYAPIRPKRVAKSEQAYADVLNTQGIEYIEIRALDVNPFSSVGIEEKQIYFLDLFLIWCALAQAPEMSGDELLCCRQNWQRIILEGRKPGQVIGLGCDDNKKSLANVGEALFKDLQQIAEVLDTLEKRARYVPVCDELIKNFADPQLTLSAQVLNLMQEEKNNQPGLKLAENYYRELCAHSLSVFSENDFNLAAKTSMQNQRDLESADTLSFTEYLLKLAAREA